MAPVRRGGPRLIALEGPSAVGKSRLAAELADALPGEALLLPEAFDRLPSPPSLDVPTRSALLATEFALLDEDRRRWTAARRARRAGRWVVADTGFLGPLTYSIGMARLDPRRDVVDRLRGRYASLGRERGLGWPDLTLALSASASVIAARRSADPVGHPLGLAARHAAVGRLEARIWRRSLAPLLGPRYVPVLAGGPVPRVLARCLREVERAGAPGPLSASAARDLHRRVLEIVERFRNS